MIIVLACPSQKTLRMRVMAGANLAKRRMGTQLLLMGTKEQTAFMEKMLEQSPIRRRVKAESNANTTAEMALLVSGHVPAGSAPTIVTSALHAPRAKLLFDMRLNSDCPVVPVERSGVHYKNEEARERKKMDLIRIVRSL